MSAVSEAICKKLQADVGAGGVMQLATGGVWPFVAPEGTPFPFVIVAAQSPPVDSYTLGGPALQESLYLVKTVDQNVSPAPAEDVRARIHVVLQGATLTITGQSLLLLRRRSQFPEYAERVNGLIYHHRGALYEVVTQ